MDKDKTAFVARLTELTALLPPGRYNKAAILTERLNRAGRKPALAEKYTEQIVWQVMRGRTIDYNVELALIEWVAEVKGETAKIRRHLDAAREGFKRLQGFLHTA